MSTPLPALKQDPWGQQLDAYLTEQKTLANSIAATVNALGVRVTAVETSVTALSARVSVLESAPPSASLIQVIDNSGAQVTDSQGDPVVL